MSDIVESYPLSPMQQGMLFHALYAPQSGVDIEQMVIRLREGLDVAAFERAWGRVIERHPVLRTSFRWDGHSQLRQDVHQPLDLYLSQEDWRGLSTQEQESRLEDYLASDRRRGFELTQAPLMRLAIFQLGEADYQCIWTFHHIILDGRSLPIVLEEVFAFYEAFRHGRELALEPQGQGNRPARPYADYIKRLQEWDVATGEGFWRRVLQGVTAPTPLVVDRISPQVSNQDKGYGQQETYLSEALTAALLTLAQNNRLSLNTIVQGAWALLLSRYSGEEDVIFGATRACRRSSVEGAESMVGLFINTLPVRVCVTPEMCLLPWLRELRAQQMAVRDYEHTPLVKIQEWSEVPRGVPLFESILVFETYRLDSILRAKGGDWRNRDFSLLEQTNYPLTVNAYGGSQLLLKIAYDRGRFDNETITRMLGHLKTLLKSMTKNPERRLSALSMLGESERHQLLVDWNDNGGEHTPLPDMCLHQLFEAQVKRTPDAPAVTYPATALPGDAGRHPEEQLTYRELNQRSNQLAHYLRSLGVGPEVLVGICMERSPSMLVAILGVLKAGGAYVPLDPAYPKERLAFILEDTQSPVLLAEGKLWENLPSLRAQVVALDTDWDLITAGGQGRQNPTCDVTPDNLAYVIHTSGSTGKPKGVLITHHNVVRLFEATQPWFHFDDNDVWTLFHSYAFDFSVWEMWGALLYGGRLVVVPYWLSRSPYDFYSLLRTQGVTVLNQTPSAFKQLVGAEEALGMAEDLALRTIIFGGEALELNSLRPWFDRHGDKVPQLVNMYGITETTVHVTYRSLTLADLNRGQDSPIGRPLPDLRVYILDQHGQPVPIGVPGELYVGGAGVARGYLNRPELTAERFVSDPFNNQSGARLYRSGDLVRRLPDGDIEYLGRIDHQVKIRGFRVELGEIESVLGQHPGVKENAVLARETELGEQQLLAYVVPQDEPGTTRMPSGASALRDFLGRQLPDYMLPSAFVLLDRLPLTANGKLDRQALPDPGVARPELDKAWVAPRDSLEVQIAKTWEEVLGVQPIGVQDNFFDLGGHSLLAVRLFARIERIFGKRLPLAVLFQAPTVEQLADLLRQAGWSSSWSSLVPIQPLGSNPPLFCLPGNLGNVFLDLGDLAPFLGPEQPVYGLQDGIQNPSQIPALAAHYIDEIRSVQAEGPYLLTGICSGGVIAFEMAQQLQAQAQEVALLALVEPPAPSRAGWARYVAAISSILRAAVERLNYHSRVFLQNGSTERSAYAQLKAKVIANMWAVTQYVPRPYPGRIALFLAEDSSLSGSPDKSGASGSRDARIDWGELAGGGMVVHKVPGSHEAITRTGIVRPRSQAQVLAEKLRMCIDGALAETVGNRVRKVF